MTPSYYKLLLLFCGAAFFISACDSIFGTKQDEITDEIFTEGRIDPNIVPEDIGYSALTPFWEGFDRPTDVIVGFDNLVYVTDAEGLHILDQAGRRNETIPFDGAVTLAQDRRLDMYVAARYDTVLTAVDPDIVWNLPAVFKIRNVHGAGEMEVVDTLIHPFMDSSRPTTRAQRSRLDKASEENDELVEITGLSVLADNSLYVSRRGPRNESGAAAPDNTVLIFDDILNDEGSPTGRMQNVGQIRALNAFSPSLISSLGLSDVASLVAAPQRESFTDDKSFLVAQGDTTRDIPQRVLWITAELTPDGLEYRPRPDLLNRDTTRADSFLYEENRFSNPSGIAYTADSRAQILITDAERDSLYLFQSNGLEGVPPPPGTGRRKAVSVSFGGTGSGPLEFRNPGGVAYFRQIVFVADTGNDRIARYQLNTDME